jgi:hypothetical protein
VQALGSWVDAGNDGLDDVDEVAADRVAGSSLRQPVETAIVSTTPSAIRKEWLPRMRIPFVEPVMRIALLGYLGRPIAIEDLMTRPVNSLVNQSVDAEFIICFNSAAAASPHGSGAPFQHVAIFEREGDSCHGRVERLSFA